MSVRIGAIPSEISNLEREREDNSEIWAPRIPPKTSAEETGTGLVKNRKSEAKQN